MKLMITGANGQVGRELLLLAKELDIETCAYNHSSLDITVKDSVFQAVENCVPDFIVNAAAYTAVDKAEEEPAMAFAVNRNGPANLACACSHYEIPLIHISTDYVFEGKKQGAYTENDPAEPLSIYGESKWRGEEEIRNIIPQHIILRTSWIFSAHGNNFVKTILRLAKEKKELRVVDDQHGCPTAASEVARTILTIIEKLQIRTDLFGTYHFCQPEQTTWYSFARKIVQTARDLVEIKVEKIIPITSADYPTPAKRPINSVLDCSSLERDFGVIAKPWKKSLRECITGLN